MRYTDITRDDLLALLEAAAARTEADINPPFSSVRQEWEPTQEEGDWTKPIPPVGWTEHNEEEFDRIASELTDEDTPKQWIKVVLMSADGTEEILDIFGVSDG